MNKNILKFIQMLIFSFLNVTVKQPCSSTHLAPVPLAGRVGRGHLGFLLALLQLLSSQHDLTAVITASRAVPEKLRHLH